MKAFKRIKTINNQEYVYEIQPYYDKKTKTTKQKSKYIGKYKGDIENAKKVREKKPVRCYSYGEFLPLLDIENDLNLKKILEKSISEKDAETILTIAMNKVINPLSLHLIESWSSGTILNKIYSNAIIKSQSISNFLKRIGNYSIAQEITSNLLKQNKTGKSLIYDITSITSYSELIELFEYGYNRNKDGLPQINYSLIIDKENEIPLMYEINLGSIPDVKTLENTLKKMKSYGIKNNTIILDRGFYSKHNLENMIKIKDLGFVIACPLSNKVIKKIITETNIEHPKYLKKYKDGFIFSKEITIEIEKNKIKGHLYYNHKKAEQEKETIYKKLSAYRALILEKIEKAKTKAPETLIKDILPSKYIKFFKWNNSKKQLEYVDKEIELKLNKTGKFILLYHKEKYNWEECLNVYNEKIMVEKSFDMLKNDLEALRLNIQSEETLKGLLLIYFISLIFKMKLNSKLKKTNLNKKYTMDKLLLELNKIKIIELENGEYTTTVLNKKHNEILKHFKNHNNHMPKPLGT